MIEGPSGTEAVRALHNGGPERYRGGTAHCNRGPERFYVGLSFIAFRTCSKMYSIIETKQIYK